jgi:hypothetical protein
MAKEREACSKDCARDLVGDWRTLVGLWGISGAAMTAAAFLQPTLREVIWTATLIAMAGACLANARRCGRTHCRFTGPFFLVMAALVVVHASGVLPLGPNGWAILGTMTAIGSVLLWWGSERLLGRFAGDASPKRT